MSLFTPADEAELAQEIVAKTLAGALHAHGSQKTLAQRAGITPVFVNNIIKRKRMPSPAMARRIAPLLPLPGTEQAAWLDHVERYWTARRQVAHAACAAVNQDAAAVVRELVACRLATFTSDPLAVRRNWERAIQLVEDIEPHL
ncbi:MAG: helix-turn-helix transcriptional regulator, partial [Anaerolineae bacterium]|nr:helix-turn-helix transcriptional regulator [Thermoflexales bacterium]MDW8408077.1 helix-turn-helix transcriptional regulator [Anaerolineae bacterium]